MLGKLAGCSGGARQGIEDGEVRAGGGMNWNDTAGGRARGEPAPGDAARDV